MRHRRIMLTVIKMIVLRINTQGGTWYNKLISDPMACQKG